MWFMLPVFEEESHSQVMQLVIKCDVENCKIRHNSLLHIGDINNHAMNLAKDWNSSNVCLGIVPVSLYDSKRILETSTVLDSGSDTSPGTVEAFEGHNPALQCNLVGVLIGCDDPGAH